MNEETINVKRALISVSDKENIIEFAKSLYELGIEIISTGGTASTLIQSGIPVKTVADITNFPEIMQGRVKTLHPKIAGGILGKRDVHQNDAKQQNIQWIDLVVCNLYPFAKTIRETDVTLETAIENIDIGGPTMIRAAAKNFKWVGVVVSPKDYEKVLSELRAQQGLTFDTRNKLSAKAFAYTAQYDSIITNYLNNQHFPEKLSITFSKSDSLRYGENPHQKAAVYQAPFVTHDGIINAKQHQGKQLSYNNILDAESAISCIREFSNPASVIIKHTNPCGVAESDDLFKSFITAWETDSRSAFGSIVALNRICSKSLAEELMKVFVEIIIAPGYEKQALEILQQKPNLRVIELNSLTNDFVPGYSFRSITGGLLLQDSDNHILTDNDLKIVTEKKPTDHEINNLLFAWKIAKHCKSNAIVIAKDQATVGIGVGQVSRIDAVGIAIHKANKVDLNNCVLASDAFFPFKDNIDLIAKAGISAIIQPGGSVRDNEVIKACNEHNIAMLFTGIRCFYH